MGLREYVRKRDFSKTPEPRGRVATKAGRSFVIQKHAASRLHYDFRIEMEGVMRSWAVPKGPTLDPGEKRLAVHVEDHPLEYSGFEGTIPKGEYGGGTVIVWDRGTWEPEGDPVAAYRKGKLTFKLHGEKLSGTWTLFRLGGRAADGDDARSWMLVKRSDDEAAEGKAGEITLRRPESVLTGRTLEEVEKDPRREWSRRGERALPPVETKKETPARARKETAARRKGLPSASELARLEGVKRGELPSTLQPQLCTLVSEVPDGSEWIHEIKFDGYRVLTRVDGRNVRLFSRNANDWTRRMDPIAGACARLGVKTALLDGEVVVQEKDGVSSFQALQVALGSGELDALRYHVFDLLHLDGWDLRGVPLVVRKAVLQALLDGAPSPLSYVDHVEGRGVDFRQRACRLGLEGVVSKRADAPYRSRRTSEWLKIRCGMRQELVIAGFTAPQGSRRHLGSLVVGYYDDEGSLRYAGKVGTGFADSALADLRKRLEPLVVPRTQLADPPRGADARDVTWVKPQLVADVEFTAWTRDGRLRHPSYEGLREDKPAREVRREMPVARDADAKPPARKTAPPAATTRSDEDEAPRPRHAAPKAGRGARPKIAPAASKRAGKGEAEVAGVRISNPQRVLYPETGATKLDVARYLESVSEWMLPHLSRRLLTLVRCPSGRTGQCFYQKHLATHVTDDVLRIDVPEKEGSGEYAYVEDAGGLIALAQSGVLEFHAWGSRVPDFEKPDLVVMDLDPAPEVGWDRVVDAAKLVREALSAQGLQSFVKTTGGKGLHVCVPIVARGDWDEVKQWSKTFVEDIARERPTEFLTKMSKDARKGRIFLDYLRNGRGATAIAAYSPRVREGAPVATPIRWDELSASLDPKRFTIETVPQRLAKLKADPWAGYFDVRQSLPGAAPASRAATARAPKRKSAAKKPATRKPARRSA
jgi:bifunctional non-homologous end joining protein LigD